MSVYRQQFKFVCPYGGELKCVGFLVVEFYKGVLVAEFMSLILLAKVGILFCHCSRMVERLNVPEILMSLESILETL